MALTSEIIAQRVYAAIAVSGMTQEAVALSCGLDPTALSKALHGQRNFSSTDITRLCDVLHVDPSALLSDGTPPPDPVSEGIARIRQLANLDRLLTENGYPPNREHRYPATILDRAIEAWLAGHISIRPVAGIIGVDADDLLSEIEMRRPWERPAGEDPAA